MVQEASNIAAPTTLPPATTDRSTPPIPEIDLRDRWLAAFLAWLLPGAGHLYQRRYGKGFLFMVCILGAFFYGIFLGSSNVVYASFRKAGQGEIKQDDARYAYLCQVGIGLPALPAMIQAKRVGGSDPKPPLWGGLMAPPVLIGQVVHRDWKQDLIDSEPPTANDFDKTHFLDMVGGSHSRYTRGMALDAPHDWNGEPNQLSMWHLHYGSMFDLGTVFTMIAGLLNLLVIFDAWGGPMTPEERVEKTK